MSLRTVADDTLSGGAMWLEPTGWAVSMYSCTTARRMAALRSSSIVSRPVRASRMLPPPGPAQPFRRSPAPSAPIVGRRNRTSGDHVEGRPTETDGLILDLAAALGRGGSGLAFIGSALRQVAEARRIRHDHLVLDDEAIGLQLFSPDGLPFPPDAPVKPAAVLARGPGLHAEPAAAVTEQEAAAIAALC